MTVLAECIEPTIVLVADTDPRAGTSILVYPDNGATTYVDGVIRFESKLSRSIEALRKALTDVRALTDTTDGEVTSG